MANLEKLAARIEKDALADGIVGNGAIAFKNDVQYRPGRPMKRRAAKLQSVALPKKFIPVDLK